MPESAEWTANQIQEFQMSRMQSRELVCALVGVLWMPSTFATTIYKWVDQNGQTQMSDVVPEAYRNAAVKIDSSKYELSDAQREEANNRLKAEVARAAAAAAARQKAKASAEAAGSPPPAISKQASRPADAGATDCATLYRLYFESQACFGPYRIASGGIKGEAYAHCTERTNPSYKCGPYPYKGE